MATMRPSWCSKAIVSIAPPSSRMTKPARPFTVAARHCMAGNSGFLARNADKEAQDLVRAIDRIERRGAFAAAVRIEHGVFGQKLHQYPGVARLCGGRKCRG